MKKSMFKIISFIFSVVVFMSISNLQAQNLEKENIYEKFLKYRAKYAKYLKVAPNLVYGKHQQNQRKDYYKTQTTLYALDSIVSDTTKIEYIYDVDGFVTEMIYYESNIIGDWEEVSKEEYIYTIDDKLAEIIVYDYDNITFSWDEYIKLEINYIGNLIDEENLYIWNSGSWLKVMYSDITYNMNNMISIEEWYELNFITMQFDKSYKVEYDYNANQDLDYLTYYDFDDNSSSYKESHRFDYYYNFNQQILMIKEQNYVNNFLGSWVDTIKTVFTYDANGLLDEEEVLYWNDNTNSWEEDYKIIYFYDQNYNNNDLLLPYSSFYTTFYSSILSQEYLIDKVSHYFDFMLIAEDKYVHDGINYVLNEESDYYYSTRTITTKSKNQANSQNNPVLYPNPVKNQLFINGVKEGNVEMYNLQGQLVLKAPLNQTIELGHLTDGIYTYKLQIENKIYTGKIIKE